MKMKRNKPPKKQREIDLAYAHPNEGYIYYNCLRTTTLRAFMKGGRVMFFEMDHMMSTPRQITEETVKSLFPMDKIRKQRPFTKKGNEKFYAVLYRKRKKYKPVFKKLCQTK